MLGVEVAKQFLGCNEHRDRDKLMDFFRKYSIHHDLYEDPSVTPWCAFFVNACERAAGNKGTGSGLARSFEKYGVEIPVASAQRGDILVFKRSSSSWQGHVTYFWDNDDEQGFVCLGGNQGDAVSFQYYPKARLIAIRRPI